MSDDFDIPVQGVVCVADGSVSSKYSPAAYLHDLWSNAKTLHAVADPNSLPNRRPDLVNLELNQDNMDTVVSTLSLSNALLSDLCKKAGGLIKDNALMADVANNAYANNYHHPLETLRELIAGLGEDPFLMLDSSVASHVYAGIAPQLSDKKDAEIAQLAQVWALTELYGVVKEEAQVMCGLNIGITPQNDDATETEIPSQINRLFNVSNNTLPAFTDGADVEKKLMQAFGINNTELTLLASLENVGLVTIITLSQVSTMYGWVLMSRSLGCTVAELIILYQQLPSPKPATWMRYTAFKAILDWLDERKITVPGLLLLINQYPYDCTPAMDTLKQELLRGQAAANGMTKTALAGAISSAFNLSSVSTVEAAIEWLDADCGRVATIAAIIPENSDEFLHLAATPTPTPLGEARYILFLAEDDYFVPFTEVEVFVAGKNVALGKKVVSGSLTTRNLQNMVDGDIQTLGAADKHPGNNTWVQIDLEEKYSIDEIKLFNSLYNAEPNGNNYNYLNSDKIGVYISDTDMSLLTDTIMPGQLLTGATMVGYTGKGLESGVLSIPYPKDFINNLLQRTLIASTLGLTTDILKKLLSSEATDPVVSQGTGPFTLKRVQELSQLKALVDRCGSNAPALLNKLSTDSLNVSLLAQYLNVDAKVLTTQVASTPLTFSAASKMVDAYLFSQRSGMSLKNLDDLRALKLDGAFDSWATLANSLMAELPPERFNVLQQKCEEGLSQALSLYYCDKSATFKNKGMEELSAYLLTDLQTGAQSQTSQIAWAIASIQLYVDRCLAGEETNVVASVKGQQFFEDWDRYNGRYSQWAGLAELLYEPENYIDPSLRLRSTESFKNLQQQLVNGPINEDAADDAFYSYLTDFEKMAEISTVNAYHNVTDNDAGITWFIGQTMGTSPEWYWRSVDHSKLSAGSGAVQAWSGWAKIDIPISPISNGSSPLIRPVFFNNRLYVAWIEARDKKVSGDSSTSSSSPTAPHSLKECIFKITHQNFDGSWSMPAENAVVLSSADATNFGSGNYSQQTMYITVDTLANQLRLCIGVSEWFINEHALFVDVNPNLFDNGLYQNSLVIINGNSETQIVAAQPYEPLSSLTNLTVDVKDITIADFGLAVIKGLTGKFTYNDATSGILDYRDNSGNETLVACHIDTDGKISGELGTGSPFIPKSVTTITGTIVKSTNHLPAIVLANCITILKDDSSPESWTLNWTSEHSYAMSSNFPARLLNLTAQGIEAVFELEELRKQPTLLSKLLDFEGALGCYYWELFFHVPILISMQLQQAQDYIGAAKWLGYVFAPNATLDWKPLPLLNDTEWKALNIQTTDPDVIAESDPMHYKLATFMHMLDLLIARGDYSYRQLERDTLVEAQMLYLRAFNLLGDLSSLSVSSLNNLPVLDKVVDKNFKPQKNNKINGYCLQLKQRLYNLRHNLTLDGQPLNLPLFANPANPSNLLSAELDTGSDSADFSATNSVGLLRFKPALEQARGLAGQLVQFGNTLQGIAERQDGEAMSQLLQTQASQLMNITCDIQDQTLAAIDADLAALQARYDGVSQRKTYYNDLYNENISANEQSALSLNEAAAALLIAGGVSCVVGGAVDTAAPNVFGLADGGNRWGGIANGIGALLSNTAFSLSTTAGVLAETESYRRRRDEWKQQMDSADCELKQLDKQTAALQVRQQAASMQKTYLLTQQTQTGQQLQFLKNKFTNQQLFGWMRNRLATIFWQFYDIAIAASLRAEQALKFELGKTGQQEFMRPGAWQNSAAGLLCGESLLIDLAQMEAAWQTWETRAFEVTRTVSLANELASSQAGSTEVTGLTDAIANILANQASSPSYSWSMQGNSSLRHLVKSGDGGALECQINLAALNILADYPSTLGSVRRIKNISVSLPALVGPYQDIQAVLTYRETVNSVPNVNSLPVGCNAIAVSHGVNDSGQFQLDFNDPRYLPFEGVNLVDPSANNGGTLILQFPNATGKQKTMLASLNDIILHIRYTIRD